MTSISIFKFLLASLQAALGVNAPSLESEALLPPAGYVCKSPVWVKRPVLIRGAVYAASMSADCAVYPQLGGDFAKLQAFSLDQLKKQGTINSGPTDTTFEGLPSLYVDTTVVIKGKDSATIRQDVQLATDREKKFISSTISKKISGTGYAEYLKKLDTRVEVLKTAVATEDASRVIFYTEMEKPWYAPEGMFINEILTRVPDQFTKLVNKVMEETSKNY